MGALATVHQPQYAVSDMERMAHAFASSKLFGVTNAEQALALCLIAQAEGRHPASAAQDYHIIQGKPSKKADAMLRDFLSSGGKVQWHELTDKAVSATFSHPAGGSVTIDWDMARAAKAGISTPMWKKYPRQMLRARVVSEGVRTVFPMATSGMYVPEEVQEFDAPETKQTIVVNAASGETIEAEVVPAEEPRKQLVKVSREAWTAMRDEIDTCASVDELKALWRSKAFQTEFDRLPQTYKDGIVEHFDQQTAALTEHPVDLPPIDPDFDHLEQESAGAE